MMLVKKELQTWDKADRVLLRSNDFIYILPCPALRGWVSNYTITFPGDGVISDGYTVIPHASATLVFSCEKCGLHSDLFGPTTRPCAVGSLANRCAMLLIVEFQPAGLYAFTGIAQKELADQIIPLEAVDSTLNRLLSEALEAASCLERLVARLDKILFEHLRADYPSALRVATKRTLETTGNISCKELAACVYYSERQLNRMFEQYVGMSTKTFSRLVRINKAIRFMQHPRKTVTSASYDAGFYDVSHFIHDFQSVCGMTPQDYLNHVSDFYSEIAKF